MFLRGIYLFLIFNFINGFTINPPKSNLNLYELNRKTVLDLGDSFKNVSHNFDHDITFVKRNSTSNVQNGPMVVIPGLDLSGLSLYANAIRASETREVYIMLAGYSREQTFNNLLYYAIKYIIDEDMKDVVLVGESFGAILTISIENRIRERIDSLILINPATSFHRTNWTKRILKIRKENGRISHAIVKHGPDSKKLLQSISDFAETHPNHAYHYIVSYFMMLFNILVTDQEKVFSRITSYLCVTQPEIDEMCKKIRIQTTIIVGKNDKMLPSSKEADRLKKLIKRTVVTVVKIDNAGHMLSSSDFYITDFL